MARRPCFFICMAFRVCVCKPMSRHHSNVQATRPMNKTNRSGWVSRVSSRWKLLDSVLTFFSSGQRKRVANSVARAGDHLGKKDAMKFRFFWPVHDS